MTDTQQTITPTPDGSQPATPQVTTGDKTEPTFSQAEVNKIAAQTRKEASEAAQKKLLESAGVDSLDTLTALLADAKKRKEAEMSEAEKLQAQLTALTQSLELEKAKRLELEQARVTDKRDNGLLALLDKAHDKSKVLTLIKAEKPTEIAALITDGAFDDTAAQKLIADYQAANAYLFKSGAPGTQSNNDGRAPNPDEKAKKGLRKSISSITRQF